MYVGVPAPKRLKTDLNVPDQARRGTCPQRPARPLGARQQLARHTGKAAEIGGANAASFSYPLRSQIPKKLLVNDDDDEATKARKKKLLKQFKGKQRAVRSRNSCPARVARGQRAELWRQVLREPRCLQAQRS